MLLFKTHNNNSLERYNWKMNGTFAAPRPSFPIFVETIEDVAIEFRSWKVSGM